MKLERSTRLCVAPDVEVRLRADGTALVALNGVTVACQSSVLGLLDAFRTPATLGDAMDRLRAGGAADWIHTTVTLQRLVEMGALRDVAASSEVHVSRVHAFERPSQHVVMLDDRPRTLGFIDALRATVRPTDVVVDIGTGTGILAIAAALAGARHVYAIESGAMGELARRVVATNGLSDRVTVLDGWSTQVDLPERANVIVSETIGSDAFDEEILVIMRDATRRFLADGGRIIPRRLAVDAVLVEVPHDVWEAETYTRAGVARWREAYGVELAPLLDAAVPARFFVERPSARSWKRLSAPVRLGEVDFASPPLTLSWTARGVATEGSERVAVMTYFVLALDDERSFSQDPLANDVAPDWPCPVWVSSRATSVNAGRTFELCYRRHGSTSLKLSLDLSEAPRGDTQR